MLIFRDFITYIASQMNSLSSEERRNNMEGSAQRLITTELPPV